MDNHYPTPPPPPRFATFIPGRSPQWKYYANIGHAKNAMYNGGGYGSHFYHAELWLYDGQTDKWVLAVNTRGMQLDTTKYRRASDQLKEILSEFTNDTL